LLGLLVGAATASACGEEPQGPVFQPDPNGVDVLFVGNSLTYFNDLPAMLAAMLVAADVPVARIDATAFPDFGLQDHWEQGDALALIAAGEWDVVVLQQGPSATEGRPSLLDYSARFAEEIRAVGAVPALYMVWPAEARSFDFDGVSESYAMAAETVDGLLLPAGEAWRAAWRRDPSAELYGPDGFHPSPAGSYAAAAVMFEQLAGRTAVGLPATLDLGSGTSVVLDQALATLLQEAAGEANSEFARAPK
jgi:hypothetical protein